MTVECYICLLWFYVWYALSLVENARATCVTNQITNLVFFGPIRWKRKLVMKWVLDFFPRLRAVGMHELPRSLTGSLWCLLQLDGQMWLLWCWFYEAHQENRCCYFRHSTDISLTFLLLLLGIWCYINTMSLSYSWCLSIFSSHICLAMY